MILRKLKEIIRIKSASNINGCGYPQAHNAVAFELSSCCRKKSNSFFVLIIIFRYLVLTDAEAACNHATKYDLTLTGELTICGCGHRLIT